MNRALREDGSNLIHLDPSDLNDLPDPRGALTSEATSNQTDRDQLIHPGQEGEGDELAALLCMALDGAAADPVRLSLLTRLALYLHEPDREADLERIRRTANHTVTRL